MPQRREAMKKYVIWDPGSHEHLAEFNHRRPLKSKWIYLDTDIHEGNKAQLFGTLPAAKRAAQAIVDADPEETCQLAVREVVPAFIETSKCIPRIG